MAILFDERKICVAADECLRPPLALTLRQWLLLYSMVAVVLALAILCIVDPRALLDPGAVVTMIVSYCILLALLVGWRYYWSFLFGSREIELGEFDLEAKRLTLIGWGVFGMTRFFVDLSDIAAVRHGIGEWNDLKVKDLLVVEMTDGRSHVLPDRITVEELVLLRVITGLRRIT